MNKKIGAFFIVVIIYNAIFNQVFELHFDETYYWVWGQNLALSYYDHPPMIAYMIRLANTFFGNSEFVTRLPALLCTTVTCIYIYKLARRAFNQEVANVALILAISCPLIQGMFFIVTPDAPLLMFWSLSMYYIYIALFEHNTRAIYLSGLFIGLGLLSKYMMILILPSIFIFLLFSKEYRGYLKNIHVYLAVILAVVIFSPVILWNYQHQWVSFLFQFHHGIGSNNINFHSFGDYLGGGLLVCGPFILLAILFYILKYYKLIAFDNKLKFFTCLFAFTFTFFAFSSLTKHVEANWPAPGFLAVLILLAYFLVKFNNRWVVKTSVGLIVFILVVAKFPLFFMPQALHGKVYTIDVMFGNKYLMKEAKKYIKDDTMVLACEYSSASRSWYYLPHNRVYVLDRFPKANAYKEWGVNPHGQIKHAIYTCKVNDPEFVDILKTYFKHVRLLETPVYSNVISDNKVYVYEVLN